MRIEVKGMTLDEAINTAMIELSTTSDNIAYEVIQEASTGFLGIGSKPCIISAYKKNDKEEVYKKENAGKKDKLVENNGVYEFKSENKKVNRYRDEKMVRDPKEVEERARKIIEPILKEFDNIDVTLEFTPNIDTNTMTINLVGENLGVVIGKHGATLDALQHLTNIAVNTHEEHRVHIKLDSENYRDKRFKTLESLAKSVANNVRKSKKSYELEPMPSYERKIIHSILQKEKNIETESIGVDKQRHIVVKYKR